MAHPGLPGPESKSGLALAQDATIESSAPMLTRISFLLGALFLVAWVVLWWTEPRLDLVGISGEGDYRGAMVNNGRTAVVAVLCDGPPRVAATCDCREVTRAALRPGERLAVEGYAFQPLTTCGIRP